VEKLKPDYQKIALSFIEALKNMRIHITISPKIPDPQGQIPRLFGDFDGVAEAQIVQPCPDPLF
jgi:hypothetical protein